MNIRFKKGSQHGKSDNIIQRSIKVKKTKVFQRHNEPNTARGEAYNNFIK